MLGERVVGRFVVGFLAEPHAVGRRHTEAAGQLQQLLDGFVEHSDLGHLRGKPLVGGKGPAARIRAERVDELPVAVERIPENTQQDPVGRRERSELAGPPAEFLEREVGEIVDEIDRGLGGRGRFLL